MSERQPDRKGDMTVAELLEQLTGQTSQLVRQELALVREESFIKASRAGMGTMLFGGAGALAVYGAAAVVAGVMAALATELPPWAAALVVVGGLLSVSGVLALMGRRELRRVFPLMPKEATERLRADARVITNGREEVN